MVRIRDSAIILPVFMRDKSSSLNSGPCWFGSPESPSDYANATRRGATYESPCALRLML